MKENLTEIKKLQKLAGIKINENKEPIEELRDASAWTKQQLDAELRELRMGFREAGDLDDSMAFDIADSWLSEYPGVEKAIKKYYPNVTDFSGFVANYIA